MSERYSSSALGTCRGSGFTKAEATPAVRLTTGEAARRERGGGRDLAPRTGPRGWVAMGLRGAAGALRTHLAVEDETADEERRGDPELVSVEADGGAQRALLVAEPRCGEQRRRALARGGRDEACPVSTAGGTRRVRLVREGRDASG